ncbi:MAG: bifunctional oligoribonuclease/PAP phosphatase NrnA [Deltaproteobacteria bacterium]|nr:bifunctional oligoribonuclease/PAP phosphatase NrnA [Deltaproteobacteria bacterium]
MSNDGYTPAMKNRVHELMDAVLGGKNALICTHDNPDPDSIASAYALGRLLEQKMGMSFTLAFGGVLGRAENKAMVKLLKITLVPFCKVDLSEFDVVGLVDTQPEVGNHVLTPDRITGKKMICVDHHPERLLSKDADYADVGGDYGATSTVLTAYLVAADVIFDRTLATALFYGIKSDTRDLGREVSDVDIWAYSHLIPKTDMPAVSAMEHPRLPRDYFQVFSRGIQRAKVFGNVLVCDLGELYIPDLVAEVADRLSKVDGIRWSLVVGGYEDDIYASLRVNDRRCSAGKLVRQVMDDYPTGSAGGHGSMAGARLPYGSRTKTPEARARARRTLLKALLNATGVEPDAQPEPLVREEALPDGTVLRASRPKDKDSTGKIKLASLGSVGDTKKRFSSPKKNGEVKTTKNGADKNGKREQDAQKKGVSSSRLATVKAGASAKKASSRTRSSARIKAN